MSVPMILLLAAGASSRMRGRDKLLEPVGGEPLLRRQAKAALATGAPVLVALPALPGPRDAALEGLAVDRVRVEAPEPGMGYSISAGAKAAMARGATALVILNSDLPGIGTAELLRVLAAKAEAADSICIATSEAGDLGHPVAFPGRLLGELAELQGDSGAKATVRREGFKPVTLAGDKAVRDLDTPEDWALWRAETGL